MERFKGAAAEIAGLSKVTGEYHAGFLHDWNDLDGVYGENLKRLREIKNRYDPHDNFNKAMNLSQGADPAMTNGQVV